ncbi:MAG: hypothetical protein ACR2HF_12830, partial [Methylococcaceae bacterium]
IEGIRIGHGCETDQKTEDGAVLRDPVVAATWIWPQGKGTQVNDSGKVTDDGMAPLSTGCDATNANCSGAGSQPSVARIADSSKKPSDASGLGVGVATTLASELVHPLVSCTTDPTTHAQTCVQSIGTEPVTTIGGRMQFLGNIGYFKNNRDTKIGGGGLWASGNKFTADQIAAMGVGSVGAPYHNAIQVLWSDTADTSKVGPMFFSPTSCARKLVVRLAGADVCHMDVSRAKINDGHSGNFWMGGPTAKFTNGHGVHENFWLGYTLLVRDVTKNPYPTTGCTDAVNGDYDLVVMPTKTEIDAGLPFPGFARLP